MQIKINPYEGTAASEARHEREAVRMLNRMMHKATKQPGLPKLVGSSVVMSLLGINRQSLNRHIATARFPPSLKGYEPAPGQSHKQWQRQKRRWPLSLVRMCVAGSFGTDVPTTQDGWLRLIEGWQEGQRRD